MTNEPVIFKPKWASTVTAVTIQSAGVVNTWVTAEGPMGQYSSGPACPTKEAAIEAWNKMWDQPNA